MARLSRSLALVALAGGAAWWLSSRSTHAPAPVASPPGDTSTVATRDNSRDEAKAALRLPPRVKTDAGQLQNPVTEAASSSEPIRFAENFTAPHFVSEGVYAIAPVVVVWDKKSCRGNPPKGATELHAFVKHRSGLTGARQYPRNLNVELISQFWKEKNLYYQITARSDHMLPASYEIHWYASTRSDFQEHLRELEIPSVRTPASVDVRRAMRLMDQLLKEAKLRGAQEGGRMMQASVSSGSVDVEPSRATFLNGQMLSFQDPQLVCAGARCGCRTGSER